MAGMRLRTALISLFLTMGAQPSIAVEGEIPSADNFAETGRLLRQQDIPAIVFVSRDACPYCRTLRNKILKPMLAADKFEHKAMLIEVSLDRSTPLTDFENRQVTAKVFGQSYNAEITPTLLFLDSDGHEIGKRIIGISNLELYGHYLHKSIEEALLTIRTGKQQN